MKFFLLLENLNSKKILSLDDLISQEWWQEFFSNCKMIKFWKENFCRQSERKIYLHGGNSQNFSFKITQKDEKDQIFLFFNVGKIFLFSSLYLSMMNANEIKSCFLQWIARWIVLYKDPGKKG